MKWLTFAHDGDVRHGYVDGDQIVVTGDGDLRAVIGAPSLPQSRGRLGLDRVQVLAPLLEPGKIIGVASNYQAHVAEAGKRERDVRTAAPLLFLKPNTAIAGAGEPVQLDPITQELDWEVELAVVIGRTARRVAEADALDYVFGYATSNDISARSLDLGFEREELPSIGFFDWLEGKWLDGSAPLGPYLVTADEVPDPQRLSLTLAVNGEQKQSGNTSEMIHGVAELIAFASRLMTLEPGDVILTGTPAGVGATTGTFLRVGDSVAAEIEGLGRLVTPIVAPRGSGDAASADA